MGFIGFYRPKARCGIWHILQILAYFGIAVATTKVRKVGNIGRRLFFSESPVEMRAAFCLWSELRTLLYKVRKGVLCLHNQKPSVMTGAFDEMVIRSSTGLNDQRDRNQWDFGGLHRGVHLDNKGICGLNPKLRRKRDEIGVKVGRHLGVHHFN